MVYTKFVGKEFCQFGMTYSPKNAWCLKCLSVLPFKNPGLNPCSAGG